MANAALRWSASAGLRSGSQTKTGAASPFLPWTARGANGRGRRALSRRRGRVGAHFSIRTRTPRLGRTSRRASAFGSARRAGYLRHSPAFSIWWLSVWLSNERIARLMLRQPNHLPDREVGRSGRIRTDDLLTPSQVRYRTAPRSADSQWRHRLTPRRSRHGRFDASTQAPTETARELP